MCIDCVHSITDDGHGTKPAVYTAWAANDIVKIGGCSLIAAVCKFSSVFCSVQEFSSIELSAVPMSL